MSDRDRQKWDAKYAAGDDAGAAEANRWLLEQVRDLPPGRALDVACGRGANAIRLAQLGWTVCGIDISPVGLQLAAADAAAAGVQVDWQTADLDAWEPPPAAFDLVTVFRYLDRDHLPPRLTGALKPGGTLLYETFVAGPDGARGGPVHNPAFVLRPRELPGLFPKLRVIDYAEIDLADRRIARLRAQKHLADE